MMSPTGCPYHHFPSRRRQMGKYPGWIFDCDDCGQQEAREDDVLPHGWTEDDEGEVLCDDCAKRHAVEDTPAGDAR